jgi:hypothetical protein
MADFSSIWSLDPNASLVGKSTYDLGSKYGGKLDPSAWAKPFLNLGPAESAVAFPATGAPAVPTGNLTKNLQEQYDFYKKIRPDLQADRASEYALQAELTRKQMSDVFPYMAAASSQATARNLAASKQFLAFKESSPTSVQNIMASKQNQAASAADAEYRRAMGIAAQQQAAQGGLRFAGQTFQVG